MHHEGSLSVPPRKSLIETADDFFEPCWLNMWLAIYIILNYIYIYIYIVLAIVMAHETWIATEFMTFRCQLGQLLWSYMPGVSKS